MIDNEFITHSRIQKGRNRPSVVFPKPEDTKVQQHFKDECDIHVKLARINMGDISLLQERKSFFADLSNIPFDLSDAMHKVRETANIFTLLPSTVRRQFKDRPDLFANWCETASVADLQRVIGIVIEEDKKVYVEKGNENSVVSNSDGEVNPNKI